MFGGIDEDSLKKAINDKFTRVYPDLGLLEYDLLLKYFFLVDNSLRRGEDIKKYLRINMDQKNIQGYILLDINEISLANNKVAITLDLDYIDAKIFNNRTPIFARIADYPIYKIENMGLGEGLLLGANLSDFGGRNHTHTTEFKIISGNALRVIKLPMTIMAKRGQHMQLYITENKLNMIFCGEAIYHF